MMHSGSEEVLVESSSLELPDQWSNSLLKRLNSSCEKQRHSVFMRITSENNGFC